MKPADFGNWLLEQTRRIVVLVVGLTLVSAGLVLLVLPGPGLLLILLGLTVLALEFVWAKTMLTKVRAKADQAIAEVRRRRPGADGD